MVHITYDHNFINSLEFLYDCGLDSGFLQQVANAEGPEARLLLLNAAYVIGWRYPSLINEYNDTCILNFLIKKSIKCFNKNSAAVSHTNWLSNTLKKP